MKIKSYTAVTAQIQAIYYTELEIQYLESEKYILLSWEDWAFCLVQLDYYPQVVTCSEEGYTVVADSLNRRLDGFNKEFN